MSDTPKSFLSRAADTAVGMVMYAPIGVAKLLPYRMRVPFMGWVTSHIVAPIAGYRGRVRDNLALVMPDLPDAEVRRLMRAVPDNAGRNMVELYSTDAFSAHARHSPVSGPGLKALAEAREKGRPVIFVTGHFGNYNAARVAMIEHGFAMGGFYRPMTNEWFNTRYVETMRAMSQPLFEQGRKGMIQMVKHLKGGGVIGILTDLNAHDGMPLTFFGKPALSSLGTAELALKYDAVLVPVWGLRDPNGMDFRVTVETPIAHSNPVTMTQEVNDRLEAQVRDHMDQWFWIHRRWKDGTGMLADIRAKQLEEMLRDQKDT